jgi:hypothetical protein
MVSGTEIRKAQQRERQQSRVRAAEFGTIASMEKVEGDGKNNLIKSLDEK